MKALIINHSNNYVYGASKSLQLLLSNSKIEYDFVSPKDLFKKHSDEELRKNFKGNIKKTFTFWLPAIMCIQGKESRTWKGKLYNYILNFMYYTNKNKIIDLCKNREYDFIYLNSMILFPIINNNAKFLIHIREVFKGNQREFTHVSKKIKQANSVIFIDHATYQPFKNIDLNFRIIANPFDMRKLESLSEKELLNTYDIPYNYTVFSILGKLIFAKGVDLVIKAFKSLNEVDAILLVVGSCEGQNAMQCLKLADNCKNIRLIGELDNPSEIYKISDYIVRGDRYVALGRTTYEGLYSSCDVILPANNEGDMFEELMQFKEKCHTYKVNDVKSLQNVLQSVVGKKVKKGNYISNIDLYVSEFEKFISNI